VYGDMLDFCREALKISVDEKGKERGGLKTFVIRSDRVTR
jgi:hypothetical protein